jgi:hypothetical protein
MQKASDKEIGRLLDVAEGGGWTVKQKRDGWMLLAPNRRDSVMVHATNSDHRAIKNLRAKLRRFGLKV